jgi:hypothetical protein
VFSVLEVVFVYVHRDGHDLVQAHVNDIALGGTYN